MRDAYLIAQRGRRGHGGRRAWSRRVLMGLEPMGPVPTGHRTDSDGYGADDDDTTAPPAGAP